MKIGTVESVWRYPVKGMAGERLERCGFDRDGLKGDRVWAVQDVERREIQSCKFRPQLLQCRAHTRGTSENRYIEIQFPDGQMLRCDDPEAGMKVSALVGYDSQLRTLRPKADADFYRRYKRDNHTWLDELKATFEREEGEPLPDLDNLPEPMQEFVSLQGTFFLASTFHILTTASLDHMKQLHPQSDWHIERFRPNLMIDTLPGIEGLAEQAWVGKTLQIGELVFNCSDPAPRCGAVTRKQNGLKADTSLLRSIVHQADQNLGIYGNILSAGTINAGDEVRLL
ncbi:MOSC domain-containing protein [Marinobacter sp.]|uniref:MOSC domain-containing protein n=1 Tax=Marinobacter sp. TaxID=50741 RepID=UPI000C4D6CAE|nr:MOSC domain-containing protein [Marinobacter sp.]MBE94232.1 MOSC domain-containing protein [Marinobacter sp.]|tara:strand:- start:484 stop:1335 length:852 start_codon:yes stop_codon:yes gene_type:complete